MKRSLTLFVSAGAIGMGLTVAAAVVLGAGAVALIAGCSAGGGSASSGGSSSAAATSASPHTALTLAADQSQHVNSMTATISFHLGGRVSETATGSLQIRVKPSLVVAEHLKFLGGAKTDSMDEFITAKALYLNATLPSSGNLALKPWTEIDFAALKGGLDSALSSRLQDVQIGNPATQTRMLTASKDVHVVGTQVVDGVQTTHYAGTFTPSAALDALSPSLRTDLAPVMTSFNGDISFGVWIDSKHVMRKLTETVNVMGKTETTTMNVTSVNQPVQVSLPPAGQVTKLSGSSLDGM